MIINHSSARFARTVTGSLPKGNELLQGRTLPLIVAVSWLFAPLTLSSTQREIKWLQAHVGRMRRSPHAGYYAAHMSHTCCHTQISFNLLLCVRRERSITP